MTFAPDRSFTEHEERSAVEGVAPTSLLEKLFRPSSSRPIEVIEALSRRGLEPLVARRDWPRFAAIGERLELPIHTLFVECRLQGEADRTDFGVGVFPGGEVTRWASNEVGRAARFLEAWSSQRAPWAGRVPFLYLAFDSGGPFDALASPCLSLCVDPHFFDRSQALRAPAEETATQLSRLLQQCHLELKGTGVSDESRDRSFSLVAAGAEPRHASFMLSRPGAPVKLDVRVPLSRLADYLLLQGWPHVATIMATLRELGSWGSHVQLNLPLSPFPARRLEVEVLTAGTRAARAQRFQLLEKLVERGLASVDKVRVLRAIYEEPLMALGTSGLLATNFYLKLGLEEGQLREAKAYVGFMPKLAPGLSALPSSA
jgi:hypothetical protein